MEIKIEDLTTMDLQGEGAFDNVMTAMQTRLDREFQKNRIKGPDYAKVYLGTYEASLMNTIQFILGRQEADKKAELLVQQTITEKDQLLTAKIGRDHVAAQILQTEKQTEKLNHDIALVDTQNEIGKRDVKLKEAELPILVQKLESEKEQTKILHETHLKLVEETKFVVAQTQTEINKKLLLDQEIKVMEQNIEKTKAEIGLITAEIQKMIHEADVMKAQIIKMESEGKLIAAQIDKITKELALVDAQVEKMESEGKLIAQKVVTEEAQTKGTPGGLVGKQMALYENQTKGFLRDAEQKLSKIYTDTLNTQVVSLEGITPDKAGLSYKDIGAVLKVARTGIGA